MKELNKHFDKVRKEGDEMAWIMMVGLLSNHYHKSYTANAEQVEELRKRIAMNSDVADRLNALGEELLEQQSAALPELMQIVENHRDLAELYEEFDSLKRERFDLEHGLKAQREALKNALRASLRDL